MKNQPKEYRTWNEMLGESGIAEKAELYLRSTKDIPEDLEVADADLDLVWDEGKKDVRILIKLTNRDPLFVYGNNKDFFKTLTYQEKDYLLRYAFDLAENEKDKLEILKKISENRPE
jgi:hypothetical protein